MVRKDLIIAILATFCLTATLFLIIPTRSQTIGNYDPWLDTNADGKIDGKDLGAAAYAFGSGGDPTKDVNVTNWPSQEANPAYQTTNITGVFDGIYVNVTWNNYGGTGGCDANWALCGGYSQMYIYVRVINDSLTNPNDTTSIGLSSIMWGIESNIATADSQFEGFNWLPGWQNYPPSPLSVTFTGSYTGNSVGTLNPIPVKAPYFEFALFTTTGKTNVSQGWALLQVQVYLRNQ